MRITKMKNKKLLAILLTSISLMSLVVGCGNSSTNSNNVSTENTKKDDNNDPMENNNIVSGETDFSLTDVENLSDKITNIIYDSTSNQDFFLCCEGFVQDLPEELKLSRVGLNDTSMFEDITYLYIIPEGEKNPPFSVTVGKLTEGSDVKKISEEMKNGLLEHAEAIMISKPDEAEIVIKGDFVIILLNDSKNPYGLKTDKLIKEISNL